MTATSAALLALALATTAPAEAGDAAVAAGSPPYVTVNLGVELHALEQAAADAAQATEELAAAVKRLAASPSLSEEHKAQLAAVIGRVDTLSSRVVTAVDRLPDAIRESREPVTAMADDLASTIRWTVILVLAAVLLVLCGALWAVYALFLRPTRRMLGETLGRFQGLAEALQTTAELVGECSVAQTALAERLDALQAGAAPEEPPAASPPEEPTGSDLPTTPG